MGVSKNSGTPKSSILIGFSIINHPFLGYAYFWKYPYLRISPINPVAGGGGGGARQPFPFGACCRGNLGPQFSNGDREQGSQKNMGNNMGKRHGKTWEKVWENDLDVLYFSFCVILLLQKSNSTTSSFKLAVS